MGHTSSDRGGIFTVAGCGDDLITAPDPYLDVYTYCNDPSGKTVIFETSKEKILYYPNVMDFDELLLD